MYFVCNYIHKSTNGGLQTNIILSTDKENTIHGVIIFYFCMYIHRYYNF